MPYATQVRSLLKETDGYIWIPGRDGTFFTGTWTDTRVSAGVYCRRKTATAEAGQAVFYIAAGQLMKYGADPCLSGVPAQSHDIRGFQVSSIVVVHQCITAALNTHSFLAYATTYADNTAPDPASVPMTGTLAVATQTQPYVTELAVTGGVVIGGNTKYKDLIFEISWDAAATSVLSYYGIALIGNYNLL